MKVALIQFKEAGKKYYFSYDNFSLEPEQLVVVETIRGIEIGRVYQLREIEHSELTSELKPIIRLATEEDIATDQNNQLLEPEVVETTKKLALKHLLDMKVLASEYTLDKKRLLIYFESETRVDFRGLVRDLSEVYQTRIELRQIGSRDAAKMIGGIGPCGLILCCSTFIGEFDAVSIKMAKNQNIALNPQKISGVCGKLLCCIKYEDDTYSELRELLPDYQDTIETERGAGVVTDLNILAQKVRVRYEEDNGWEWVHIDELKRVKA